MCDGRLGWQPGGDKSCRCWSLRYAVGAGTAGILGTTSDDAPELRRNDIQSLGHVLADATQAAATAADQAFWFNDLFDTRKMGGKRAPIGYTWYGMRLATLWTIAPGRRLSTLRSDLRLDLVWPMPMYLTTRFLGHGNLQCALRGETPFAHPW